MSKPDPKKMTREERVAELQRIKDDTEFWIVITEAHLADIDTTREQAEALSKDIDKALAWQDRLMRKLGIK